MDLFSKRQSYAIRKLTVGTASVLVGCFLLGQQALAEETATPTPPATEEVTELPPSPAPVTAPAEVAPLAEAPTNEETPAPAATTENEPPRTENEVPTPPAERPSVELERDEIATLYTENKVIEKKNLTVNTSNGQRVNLDADLDKLKALTDATVHMELKADGINNFRSLFSVSSNAHQNNYLAIYSNNGVIGVEGRNGSEQFYAQPATSTTPRLVDGEWNAVTVTFHTSQPEAKTLSIYVNGVLAFQNDQSNKFIKDLVGANHAQIGRTIRQTGSSWGSDFSVANFTVYNRVLTPEEVARRAGIFKRETYPERLTEDMVITNDVRVFASGTNKQKAADGIYSYRIPALITTNKGTLLAAGDARETHSADWGNIGIALKRSEDQGETWSDRMDVINIRNNPNPANPHQQSPVTIDAALVQHPDTNRIFVVYDMFLEGQAIHSLPAQYEQAYEVINGKTYRVLYHSQEAGRFTVRENGRVFTPTGQETDYRVIVETATDKRADIGDIYQNDTLLGNIFFTTNKKSPFRGAKASYLWMQYSDDDGKNWSNPVDLTPMVSNEKMKFHGVGPGAGIVLHKGPHKGRIVIPTYSTNFPGHLNSQSSRVIYSDDNGANWSVSASPNDNRVLSNGTTIHTDSFSNSAAQNTEATVVQLDNGQLKLFMRNLNGRVQVTTSTDGGQTWGDVETISEVVDVYVQLSAIHTHHKGKEYIILSNANGPGRTNGYLRVAEVKADGSFEWLNQKLLQKGSYAYNSLTKISDDNYGILYEHSEPGYNDYSLHFKRFNLAYALAQTEPIAQVIKIDKLDNHHVRLQFDKPVWATQAEHLRVKDGGTAYFTSQDSPTSLIYMIGEQDWGKQLADHTARHIININKVDVLIRGQLPTADTPNQHNFDIRRRLNDVVAQRVGYNKARITMEDLGAGASYFIERHNLDTGDIQLFQTTQPSFLDQTIRSNNRYTYYARGEKGSDLRAQSFASTLLPQVSILDDRDPSIVYGRAFANYRNTGLYNQSEKYADITGNTTYSEADITATIPFVGRGIEIYGLKHSGLSFARVRIDGQDRGQIDFNKAGAANGSELVGQFTDLEDGLHTLELIVNNQAVTRNGESNKISLDYFRVLSADPAAPEVLDDRDNRVQYGAAFHDYPDTALYGGTEKYADITNTPATSAADATLTLDFEGTGIQIYGNRSNRVGEGLVTIDGVAVDPLIFYKASGAAEKGVLIGEYRGLENKRHRLTIRVNPNSKTSQKKVSLDAFVILRDHPTEITSPLLVEVGAEENDLLLLPPRGEWERLTLTLEGVEQPILLTPTADKGIQTSEGQVLTKREGVFVLPLPAGFNRDQLRVATIKASTPLGESNQAQTYIRPALLTAPKTLHDQATGTYVILQAGESKAIEGLRVGHIETKDRATPAVLADKDFDLYDIETVDQAGKDKDISRPARVILPVDQGKTVEKVLYLPTPDSAQEVTFVQQTDEHNQSYVAFSVEHFSHYALVYRVVTPPSTGEETKPDTGTETNPKPGDGNKPGVGTETQPTEERSALSDQMLYAEDKPIFDLSQLTHTPSPSQATKEQKDQKEEKDSHKKAQQAPANTLPSTGEASTLSLFALGLVAGIAGLGSLKRRRED